MNREGCPRPLDPIDAEAVVAGAEPIFASDAAEHARRCPECGSAVGAARRLSERLEQISAGASLPELADRVLRLRPFSRLERRSFALWRAPSALAVVLFFAGFFSLALPGISARQQAGLMMAALAPLLAVFRAGLAWLSEVAAAAPAGLQGLSEAFRRQPVVGLVALLLLAPFSLGLRSVLSRAHR